MRTLWKRSSVILGYDAERSRHPLRMYCWLLSHFCGCVINICSCTGDFVSLTQTLHNAPKSIPQNFGPRYSTLGPQLGVTTPMKSPRSPFYKPLQSTLIAPLPQSTRQDSITSPHQYCFNRLFDGQKCARVGYFTLPSETTRQKWSTPDTLSVVEFVL